MVLTPCRPRIVLLSTLTAALPFVACGLDLSGSLVGRHDDAGGSVVDGSSSQEPDGAETPRDGGDGGASIGTDAGVGADASDGSIANPCGPSMVCLPNGAAPFCVDPVETTEACYGQFKAANVGLAELPLPACATKASFRAGSSRGAMYPVSDVDWCDAFVFCKWAGKRLCSAAEWLAACGDGSGRTYPYGNTFDQALCNGGPVGAPVTVGSLAGCKGTLNVFDMSGNMDEWTSACTANTGLADSCTSRGGDWQNDTGPELACTASIGRFRSTAAVFLGFRCCK